VGGKGSQLQVWSLATQQRTFQAKGGKPNHIGLVDPAHVTAAAWAPGGREDVVVVGNAEHKVCVYDLKAGRRPQLELSWGKSPITALAAGQDGECAATRSVCPSPLISTRIHSAALAQRRIGQMGAVLRSRCGAGRTIEPPMANCC
jgi:hypothetical protein